MDKSAVGRRALVDNPIDAAAGRTPILRDLALGAAIGEAVVDGER